MNQTTLSKSMPIGVFDSGLGGISVLRVLKAAMPNESYLYFGDSANAPYGLRTTENVRELTEKAMNLLRDHGAKCFVIACNTATSASVHYLQEKYPDYPIIGIQPAIEQASESSEHPLVAAMATPVTLRGEMFNQNAERLKDKADIVKIPAPKIVEFVEKGVFDSPELQAYISSLYAELCPKTPDCVVLGCTHFPFVKDCIQKVLKTPVKFFDGAYVTTDNTIKKLTELDLLTDSTAPGTVTFLNSSKEMLESGLCEMLLNTK